MSQENIDYMENLWQNNKPEWFAMRQEVGDDFEGGMMDMMMLGNINEFIKPVMYSIASKGYKPDGNLEKYQRDYLNDKKNYLKSSGVPSVFEDTTKSRPMIDLYEAIVRKRYEENGGNFMSIANYVENALFGKWFTLNDVAPQTPLYPKAKLTHLGLNDRNTILRGFWNSIILPVRQGKELTIGYYGENTDAESNFNTIYEFHNKNMMRTLKDLEIGNLAIVPVQSTGQGTHVKEGWVYTIRYGDPDRPDTWHIVGEVLLNGEVMQYDYDELLAHFASGHIIDYLEDYKDDWWGGFGWEMSRDEIIKLAHHPASTESWFISKKIPRLWLLGWSPFGEARNLEYEFVIQPLAEMLKKDKKLTVDKAVEIMLEEYRTPPVFDRNFYRRSISYDRGDLKMLDD